MWGAAGRVGVEANMNECLRGLRHGRFQDSLLVLARVDMIPKVIYGVLYRRNRMGWSTYRVSRECEVEVDS